MRETRYWMLHLAAGVVILVLLGLHLLVMHLDGVVGWLNPAGGEAVGWENVLSRSRLVLLTISYIVLLAAALYHGIYGLRTIIQELNPSATVQKLLCGGFWVGGTALFLFGVWAAIAAQTMKVP